MPIKPKYEKGPTKDTVMIQLTDSSSKDEDDVAALLFRNPPMREFFEAYRTLSDMRERLTPEMYNEFKQALFAKSAASFTPGSECEYERINEREFRRMEFEERRKLELPEDPKDR